MVQPYKISYSSTRRIRPLLPFFKSNIILDGGFSAGRRADHPPTCGHHSDVSAAFVWNKKTRKSDEITCAIFWY